MRCDWLSSGGGDGVLLDTDFHLLAHSPMVVMGVLGQAQEPEIPFMSPIKVGGTNLTGLLLSLVY